MIIETLTDTAAAICLSAGELPTQDSPECMCAIVRQAQAARGMRLWRQMEADVFVYGERALLLARPVETECFAFPSFETLLAAVLACPEALTSSLTYLDGVWLLRIRCPSGKTPAALLEFGQRAEGGDALAAHFAEHGQMLIPTGAMAQLRQAFSRV